MGEGIGAPGPEDGYRYGWRYNMRRGQAEMLQRFPSGGSGRERFFEHQTGIQDALSLTFAYLRLFMYEIAKVVEYGCGVYLAYRLVRYFGKQDYERANNSIDQLLGIVIDFTVSVVAALLLPLATILGFRSFVWVGHHDAVEVCDLCGGGPVCQSYIDHTNGINLCAEHRWSEENRLRKANAYEAQEQWVESLNEKKSETENDDVQRASVLPSGRRFSPVPFPPRPPHPLAFDRGYSSSDAGGRYSGSRHHNPGRVERQRLDDNSFGDNQAFLTTRKRREAWYAHHDALLPPETQRVLWSQSQSRASSSKWSPTPSKRFL